MNEILELVLKIVHHYLVGFSSPSDDCKVTKFDKTTKIFHRYFFHRYYFVYLTHSKKPYDVIKMGNFINYLRTSITITYLKIIKIEALLFFQNSTNLLRLFSEFVHILFSI